MSKRKQPVRQRRRTSAADWPPSSEIDGYVWNTVHEPSGPSPEDREWAAASLNGEAWHDQDAEVPDDILDAQADEAAAMDRLERGLL